MHVTGVTPLHAPVLSHAKAEKHLFVVLGLHVVPTATAVCTQPLTGSHAAVWHVSIGEQGAAVVPLHVPVLSHAKAVKHLFVVLGLHVVPTATAVCTQPLTESHAAV